VGQALTNLMHSFKRVRARLKDDAEWSSLVLLRHLAAGPMRAASLAEATQFDPSTVSRQVALLLKDGLVERQADPVDGRAALLTLTSRAHAALAEHDHRAHRHLERLFEGWDPQDVGAFSRLFQRFAEDFDTATTNWLGEQASSPQSATRSFEDSCDPDEPPTADPSGTPAPATQRTRR
jgi:DNA-binding MarR family transcriptional regulator